jgi:hypothetical protein
MRWLSLALAALVLAGCGADFKAPSVPTFPTPSSGHGSDGGGGGDVGTFLIDGQRITIQQSGTISVRVGGVPQISYTGPLGCKGRFFSGDVTEHIRFYFRYTRHGAYLYVGNGSLYHFASPPKRSHGGLTWDDTFDGNHIAATVGCPLPRARR